MKRCCCFSLFFWKEFSSVSSSRTVTEIPEPQRQPSSNVDAHWKWHRPGWEWHWEPRGKSWAVRWHRGEMERQLEPENNTELNAYNKNSQNAENLSVIPKGLRQTFSILGRNQDEDKNKIRLVRWSVAPESFSGNACHTVLWKLGEPCKENEPTPSSPHPPTPAIHLTPPSVAAHPGSRLWIHPHPPQPPQPTEPHILARLGPFSFGNFHPVWGWGQGAWERSWQKGGPAGWEGIRILGYSRETPSWDINRGQKAARGWEVGFGISAFNLQVMIMSLGLTSG